MDSSGAKLVSGQSKQEGTTGKSFEYQKGLMGVVSIFASGNLIAALLRTVAGLVAAKLVSPATLGLFNGFGLSRQYAQFLLVGVGPGMNREMAFHGGAGNDEKVHTFASTALYSILVLGAIVCLLLGGFGLYSLFIIGRNTLAAGWLTYAIIVPLSFLEIYMLGVFRVFDSFGRLAFARIVRSSLFIVGLVFVYFFGFYGLCLRLLLSSVIFMWLLWTWNPYTVKPSWNCRSMLELLKTGLPIWGANQVENLWSVVNATLILKIFGPEGFGLYAIARLTESSLKQLPSAMQQVLQPRMAVQYGKTGDLLSAYKPFLIPAIVIGISFIPLAAVGWFVIPFFVHNFLPKYAGGIKAAQWVMIPVIFQIFRAPVGAMAAVSKRQYFNVGGLVLGILVYAVVLWKLGYPSGLKLESFVQAYAIGRVVDMVLSHSFATHYVLKFAKR